MEKIIRVTGEGLVNVKPDTIEVGLLLEALNKNYGKSLDPQPPTNVNVLAIPTVEPYSYPNIPALHRYYSAVPNKR